MGHASALQIFKLPVQEDGSGLGELAFFEPETTTEPSPTTKKYDAHFPLILGLVNEPQAIREMKQHQL